MYVAQEGHRGLNRKAAKILVQIGELHGVDKHMYTHAQKHTPHSNPHTTNKPPHQSMVYITADFQLQQRDALTPEASVAEQQAWLTNHHRG